ncbi:hypothetical protein [Mycobacterium sp. 236(2023)]|uniref:hypothetical protein n=1 Tax=Mycobacterium sp. 236(2023) TaxID=3038163 RepID=UPI002415180F|nr:hypothetical protein [Mycobacterium sp. 236(2023)]MDG4663211.1 hypothetical protein [Mycobacterium sp. 236(2023)]
MRTDTMIKKTLSVAAGAAAMTCGVVVGGFTTAAAQPIDYATLPVNPNAVTDSSAWVAEAPVTNPEGQPGVMALFTHRDGSRTVTDTILVLDDAAGAASVLSQGRAGLGSEIANATTQPAPVGTDGMITSGTSLDNSRSISALTFTEGNTVTTIEFEGAPTDPVPPDLVIDYGRMQASAIQAALSA